MGAFYLHQVEEEYRAGRHLCAACSQVRRHYLRVRFWRMEVLGRVWELRQRYELTCGACSAQQRLRGRPADVDLAAMAAGEDAAGAKPAEEGQGARGPLYIRLRREMDLLLSNFGAEDRGRLLAGAHLGIGGILLEYARRQAHGVLRQAAAAGFPAAEPGALQRVLEDELFAAGWAGYTAYIVIMRAQGHGGGVAPAEAVDYFVRRVGALAMKRAERGRHAALPEVAAWVWDHAAAGPDRLGARGWDLPLRLRPAVERALRDALHLGYAVGVQEGRYRS